jgi:hypothetical protein
LVAKDRNANPALSACLPEDLMSDSQLRFASLLPVGDEGLVEMALAIASCRVFPITKRALGYAVSCSAVAVRV